MLQCSSGPQDSLHHSGSVSLLNNAALQSHNNYIALISSHQQFGFVEIFQVLRGDSVMHFVIFFSLTLSFSSLGFFFPSVCQKSTLKKVATVCFGILGEGTLIENSPILG